MLTSKSIITGKNSVQAETTSLLVFDVMKIIEELNDTLSEQFVGGSIMTPEATAGDSKKTPQLKGNSSLSLAILSPVELGLKPFYLPLPTLKLARLGHLGRTAKMAHKIKTIPSKASV